MGVLILKVQYTFQLLKMSRMVIKSVAHTVRRPLFLPETVPAGVDLLSGCSRMPVVGYLEMVM